MKIRLDTLALNILIIVNVLNGAVWEAVSLLLLAYFLVKEMTHPTLRIKEYHKIVAWCVLWFSYFIMQWILMDLDFTAAVRLFGITKSIAMPCIILLCFYSHSSKKDIILSVMPALFVVTVLGLIDFLTGWNFFVFGGLNYLGVICLAGCIYILKEGFETHRILKAIFAGLSFIIVLASGSRSLLLACVVLFAYEVLTEPNRKLRRFYLLVCVLLALFLGVLFIEVGLNYDFLLSRGGNTIAFNISRALTVFTAEGRTDEARNDLVTRALAQYSRSPVLQQIWGSGDNRVHINMAPVHNCFLEVLLCYGSVGLGVFLLYFLFWIRLILKKSRDKTYAVLIFLLVLIFGMTQPFITTGTVFQMMVGLVFLSCINCTTTYQKIERKHRFHIRIRRVYH